MSTEPGRCRLCGREVAADASTRPFCSSGCRHVHETLGDSSGSEPSGQTRTVDATEATTTGGIEATGDDEATDHGETTGDDEADAALERVFLAVDGMHSTTCEAFLERVAAGQAGVADAEASYVTETVRVEYDPSAVTVENLADALSVVGYSAVPRSDVDDDAVGTGADTGLDEVLGYRYAAGVVFASFLMLPYLLVVYPIHVTSLFDTVGVLSRPEGSALGSGGGPLVIPVFLVLTAVVVFFTGLPMLRGAYVSLKLRRANTDLLVATTVVGAYLYSIVMGLLGRIDVFYDLAVLVAAGVVAATYSEVLAKREALSSLTDLTVSRVSEARRYSADGSTTTVAVDDLVPGDRVLVRRGERVPVDGELAEGECTVDEAVVTGESTPVRKAAGDDLVGGSVVTGGAAIVRVGEEPTSGVDRLTTAVWEVQSATHGIQRRADRVASRVAPAVVGLAGLAFLGGAVLGGGPVAGVVAFLAVLFVASPWALGLATPLAVASSIEEATRRGVVVLDETVLERLRGTDVVVFDKTGTLTSGRMEVLEADAPPDLLRAAAALERRASHPAAEAVVAAFGDGADSVDHGVAAGDGGVAAAADAGNDAPSVESFTTHATGVEGRVDDRDLLVGNRDLFTERGWSVEESIEAVAVEARRAGRLPVVVGRDGRAEGLVVVGDEPREGWEETLAALAARDLDLVVLTGDSREASEPFAAHSDVDHVFAGVPPEGKTATIRRLQATGHVTMVGDGTNDAPALAAADLGVALGSGTALASEAADLAIVDDDLSRVETAFDLATASRRRLVRNTVAALTYNVVAIPLAALGLLNPVLVMGAALLTAGLVVASTSPDLLDG